MVFRLDEFERRCDSFYLALDNYLLPEDEDAEKVRAVLVRLLEQWRLLITGLGPGEVTYLPYEFDDQCSGWIQVTAVRNDDVESLPVWSNLEGWAFYRHPSLRNWGALVRPRLSGNRFLLSA